MYDTLFRLSLRYRCASLDGIKTKMQEIYHFIEIFTYTEKIKKRRINSFDDLH